MDYAKEINELGNQQATTNETLRFIEKGQDELARSQKAMFKKLDKVADEQLTAEQIKEAVKAQTNSQLIKGAVGGAGFLATLGAIYNSVPKFWET